MSKSNQVQTSRFGCTRALFVTQKLLNRAKNRGAEGHLKFFSRVQFNFFRVQRTQLEHNNWQIKSILSGLVTRRLYFKQKNDVKQPKFPPCRNWPICWIFSWWQAWQQSWFVIGMILTRTLIVTTSMEMMMTIWIKINDNVDDLVHAQAKLCHWRLEHLSHPLTDQYKDDGLGWSNNNDNSDADKDDDEHLSHP